MSADMLSWLRSTIEGDKAAAEAATPVIDEDGCHSAYRCWHDFDGTWVNPTDQEHIARQDPQHTIARCGAELAIIAECVEVPGRETLAERTIERLATGYRHREGFNPDWLAA